MVKIEQNNFFQEGKIISEKFSFDLDQAEICNFICFIDNLPVMAAVAVRKKVVSIGHFSPSFYLQSLQLFLFVRSNQEQLYVLIALKIREK